jgi:hypothetical protein
MVCAINPGKLLIEIGNALKSQKCSSGVYTVSEGSSWKISIDPNIVSIYRVHLNNSSILDSKDTVKTIPKWKRNLKITIHSKSNDIEETPTTEEKMMIPYSSSITFKTMNHLNSH